MSAVHAQAAVNAQEGGDCLYGGYCFGDQIGMGDCAEEQHVLAQHQHADILTSRESVALQSAYDEMVKGLASVIVHSLSSW